MKDLRDQFFKARHDPNVHLGMGDIRISMSWQLDICNYIDQLTNKIAFLEEQLKEPKAMSRQRNEWWVYPANDVSAGVTVFGYQETAEHWAKHFSRYDDQPWQFFLRSEPEMNDVAMLEVKINETNIKRLAQLTKLWKRSYLYDSLRSGFVILAADEIEEWDTRLAAVFGPLKAKELKEFLEDYYA